VTAAVTRMIADPVRRAAIVAFALSARRFGLAVVELAPGTKVPPRGSTGWSTGPGIDDAGIAAAAARGANFAVRAGALPDGRGLLILDVDKGDPIAVLDALGLRDTDGRHLTLTVATGRPGGLHIYLVVPRPLPSRDRLDLGGGLVVEAKGLRKMTVAAGSVHPSGVAYAVHRDSVAFGSPDPFAFIADAPLFVVTALTPKPPPVAAAVRSFDERTVGARLVGALRRGLATIANAVEQRNNAIFGAARFVGRVAAYSDAAARDAARAMLVEAAVARCPDEAAKATDTAARGFDEGIKRPADDRQPLSYSRGRTTV